MEKAGRKPCFCLQTDSCCSVHLLSPCYLHAGCQEHCLLGTDVHWSLAVILLVFFSWKRLGCELSVIGLLFRDQRSKSLSPTANDFVTLLAKGLWMHSTIFLYASLSMTWDILRTILKFSWKIRSVQWGCKIEVSMRCFDCRRFWWFGL